MIKHNTIKRVFGVLLILAMSFQTFGQNVTLDFKNASISSVLTTIQKELGLSVVVKSNDLDLTKTVSLSADKQDLALFIQEVFASTGQKVDVSIDGKTVSVSVMRADTSAKSMTDNRVVTGKVVDKQTRIPVVGAGVFEIGNSNNGTVTDINGLFSLAIPSNAIILVSCLGYSSREEAIGGRTNVEIVLEEEVEMLDNVVVTALGVKRSEKALGYSVQKVETQGLASSKGVSLGTSLTGKIAGLNVQNSTEFDSAPSLLLRGEAPKIIIDGIPYANIGLDQLAAEDIESIDVLKGATASALYGAQASTGVIMITTKKGASKEGVSVEFNSNTMLFSGFLAFPENQTKYSSGTAGKMNYDACWGDRLDVGHTALMYNPKTYQIEEQELTSKGANNFKHFLDPGFVTNNHISISNRGQYGAVRASINHIYNKGQYANQDLNKFNFTVGGDVQYKRFSMDVSLGYNKHDATNINGTGYGGSYIYNLVVWGTPQYDIREFRNYWKSGKEGEEQNWYESAWYNNPFFQAYEMVDSFSTDYMNASLTLSYELSPWLKAVLRAGADTKTVREEWHNAKSASQSWERNGSYGVSRNMTTSINTDAMLLADKDFGKFRIEGLLGGNMFFYHYDNVGGNTRGGINVPAYYSLKASNDPVNAYSALMRQRINSLYGKTTFSWDDTYFIDVTGRNDWSSTLSEEEKSYFYPSVAGSAILSQIIKMPNWWDFLKVRGSWTMTKTPAGIYDINNSFTINSDVWSGYKAAYYPETLKGGIVKPQTSQSWEVGLNSKFFKNRLYADFAFYQKNEYDFIRNGGVSQTTGYSSVQINCSETRRRQGFEISIGGRPVESKDFTWDVLVNLGHDRYTYQSIDPDYSTKKSWVYKGADYDWIDAWDWQKDPDGNLVISDSGQPIWMPVATKAGKTTPDLVAGLGNTFKYKNWTVSFSFDGRFGGVMFAKTYQALMNSGAGKDTDTQYRYDEVMNGKVTFIADGVNVVSGSVSYDASGNVIEDTRSFKKNDITTSYGPYIMYYYGNCSSRYMQCMLDASFVKLRDFSIIYDIPKCVYEKIRLKGASVGVTGQNVFLFTNFKAADPDTGYDDLNAPSQRYLGCNVKINF